MNIVSILKLLRDVARAGGCHCEDALTALEAIPDGHVVGADSEGCAIRWDADDQRAYLTGDRLDVGKAIVVAGNPVDGFRFVGPFESDGDAVGWVGRELHRMPDWWVTAALVSPKGF